MNPKLKKKTEDLESNLTPQNVDEFLNNKEYGDSRFDEFVTNGEDYALESLIILLSKRDDVNGEELSNWCDFTDNTIKYSIYFRKEIPTVQASKSIRRPLTFKTKEISEKFLMINYKEILIAKPLL